MRELDIYAQLARLKETDYKNTLAIISIIESLIDKGIITKSDIALKSSEIENEINGEDKSLIN